MLVSVLFFGVTEPVWACPSMLSPNVWNANCGQVLMNIDEMFNIWAVIWCFSVVITAGRACPRAVKWYEYSWRFSTKHCESIVDIYIKLRSVCLFLRKTCENVSSRLMRANHLQMTPAAGLFSIEREVNDMWGIKLKLDDCINRQLQFNKMCVFLSTLNKNRRFPGRSEHMLLQHK